MRPHEHYDAMIKEHKMYINYAVSSHCNLKCYGCRTHSAIAKAWNVSAKQFIEDMNELCRLGFNNDNLSLSFFGGDPLVHPGIETLIKLCKYPLGITTNGKGLLTLPNSFFETCRKHNVGIAISFYVHSDIDYKRILERCDKFKVKISNADDSERMINKQEIDGKYCKDRFIISRNDPMGRYDQEEQYEHCCSIYPIIQDGKLFKCVIHNVTALNEKFGTDFKLIPNEDYLILKNINNMQEIYDWFNRSITFCKYCGSDGLEGSRNHNEMTVWKPSTFSRTEWIIDSESI